jgi:AcrR family transcriptional regulator
MSSRAQPYGHIGARPGRPRDEQARKRILHAALEIVSEADRFTIEAIARRAGVGKQTVYRWWGSRGEVLLEGLVSFAAGAVRAPRSADPRRDLELFLGRTIEAIRDQHAAALAILMADAQHDPQLLDRVRVELIEARRSVARGVLVRLRDSGAIAPEADLDLLLDLAYGTIWYRLLVRHLPLSDELAEQLTDAVVAAGSDLR